MPRRLGLAVANPSTRTRVARKGIKALWAQGKAHKFTPDEARRHGQLFDSQRGREAALRMHAQRRLQRRNEPLRRIEELEARYAEKDKGGD